MKKFLSFGIVVLFVSVSVIQITGIIVENNFTMIKEINASLCYLKSDISEVIASEKSSKMGMLSRDSYIIYDTEFDDYHPTIAGDTRGRLVAGFEMSIDGVDYYPDFWYSLDDGMTWEEAGYFPGSLGAAYPDIDSNEYGFYSTFGAIDIPGQLWLVIAEDLEYITAKIWDWSTYGFNDFIHLSISCYTLDDEPWNYGGMAGTGYNGYQTYDVEGCPFIFYPYSEDGCIIDWLRNLEDCYHSDIAIDEVTEMSYAVYDNLIDENLIVRKDNFSVWNNSHHPFIGAWYVGDGVTHLWNPSIEAHDDTVVIVCEEKDNIVCFYSSNGFSSVQKSTVVTSAQYPEVKVTLDGELFFCSYVKDDILCRRTSEDGGATWVYEMAVDGEVYNEIGCHDLARGIKGIYHVWEDTRGGDIDIYFGHYVIIPPPFFEITSIRGPIGIQVELFNDWTEDLNYIEWNIKVKRGLIFYGREKTGIIERLPSGNRTKISSSVFGIGHIKITVNAEASEGCSDEDIVWARIIGPFTFWFHK